jgi:hypothetical protein
VLFRSLIKSKGESLLRLPACLRKAGLCAPQFYGAGLCAVKKEKNKSRKVGKPQRPPEVIPSGCNFFAPWRLCEKKKRNKNPLRSTLGMRTGKRLDLLQIGIDYNFFAPTSAGRSLRLPTAGRSLREEIPPAILRDRH